jgi:hypothetical protein
VHCGKWEIGLLEVAEFSRALRWNGHRVSSSRTPQFRPLIARADSWCRPGSAWPSRVNALCLSASRFTPGSVAGALAAGVVRPANGPPRHTSLFFAARAVPESLLVARQCRCQTRKLLRCRVPLCRVLPSPSVPLPSPQATSLPCAVVTVAVSAVVPSARRQYRRCHIAVRWEGGSNRVDLAIVEGRGRRRTCVEFSAGDSYGIGVTIMVARGLTTCKRAVSVLCPLLPRFWASSDHAPPARF